MTMEQLSAQTVKIQLSETELQVFLHEPQNADPNSPQMLRLISFLLAKAELYCEIPFSQGQVTVELLAAPDGGLVFYFTCCDASQPDTMASTTLPQHKTVRLAGRFLDYGDLQAYCKQLLRTGIQCAESSLYEVSKGWILLLRLSGNDAARPRHLLGEFGTPLRYNLLLRARLAEYGTCRYARNAAAQIAAEAS